MIDADVSPSTGRTTAKERGVRPRRSSAPADPLTTRAEELVALVKGIGATPKPGEVHKLRTTIRRVETLLPESDAAPLKPERKVRKQLARLRRCAGKVRDADVQLKALGTFARDAGTAEARVAVSDFLKESRAKCEKRLARTIAAERGRGLAKRLRHVVARAAVPFGLGDPERILAVVIARFTDAVQRDGPLTAANLHVFRVHTKRLRYLAETGLPNPDAALAVTQLKQVQDAIGAWHDLLTLAERAAKVLDGGRGAALLAAIQVRAERQLAKAVAVTARVERRLRALAPVAPRKGVHSMTSAGSVLPKSAGASA